MVNLKTYYWIIIFAVICGYCLRIIYENFRMKLRPGKYLNKIANNPNVQVTKIDLPKNVSPEEVLNKIFNVVEGQGGKEIKFDNRPEIKPEDPDYINIDLLLEVTNLLAGCIQNYQQKYEPNNIQTKEEILNLAFITALAIIRGSITERFK